MTRYLISDLHLGHANIIKHCDRPFDDVEEMNKTLVKNWNAVVNDDQDIVIFLGDLGRFAEEDELRGWLDTLNGRIIFIEGNHDSPSRYVDGLNTHQYYMLSQGEWRFCCTHDPATAPQSWDGWILHGHHHGDSSYPLIDPDNKRANLSAEVINYQPLSVPEFMDYFKLGEQVRQVD